MSKWGGSFRCMREYNDGDDVSGHGDERANNSIERGEEADDDDEVVINKKKGESVVAGLTLHSREAAEAEF